MKRRNDFFQKLEKMTEKHEKNVNYCEVIQWLQRNYIEIPGTSSVNAKDVYNHYCQSSCPPVTEVVFGRIARQIFGNVVVRKGNGKYKYSGLRLNFMDDQVCQDYDFSEIAKSFSFFPMPSQDGVLKFGLGTNFSTNRNDYFKVIQIFPDRSFQFYVGGISVNPDVIGLNGIDLSSGSYMNAKIIFNTLKQSTICRGKCIDTKTNTNKFSIVQEWIENGDENSLELRRTSRKCKGVLPFNSKSCTCKPCSDQKHCSPSETPEPKQSGEELFKNLFPGASDLMVTFIRLQSDISSSQKDKRSRRWNKEIIQVCLSLWNRSPEAYSTLRNSGMMILPSETLLSRYKNCLQQTPGINEEMFQWMSNESEKLQTEKNGGLIMDEMSIQEDLNMSCRNGLVSIDGLIEMGQFVEDMNVLNTHKHETRTASSVLQFLFLGYDGFRFPIAYYPTAGANASELYDMVWSVINKLTEYDFYIDYVCFDGCSNNRAFQMMHFNDVQDAKEKKFTIVSPYYPSQKITFMMDYSHNIKKLRNNLHSSGNTHFSTRKLTKGDQFIVWDFWIDAYKWDKQFNTPIRVHQKLTDEHIFLNKTSKMRNHLAEQVLDSDMLNLMLKYQATLFNGRLLDMTIELLNHTSKVVELFRDNRPVSDIHDQRLGDLQRFEAWLEEWSNSIENCSQCPSEKKKSFITRETYCDIISMIHGFICLCKRRIKNNFKSLTPAGINSDVVENFFCMQRTINHGSNSNPTIHQYKYAINATVLGQNAVSKKSNASTKRKSCQPFNFTCPKPLNKNVCIRL